MYCFLGLAFAAVALLGHVPTALSECCGGYAYPGSSIVMFVYRCADCRRIQYHYCGAYGHGGCNIFGCNCGGGCIQPVKGRMCTSDCCDYRHERSVPQRDLTDPAVYTQTGNYSGLDVIRAGDLDEDGHLDELEVHLYLTQRGIREGDVTAWRALDADADGRLTPAEIDGDLAPRDFVEP